VSPYILDRKIEFGKVIDIFEEGIVGSKRPHFIGIVVSRPDAYSFVGQTLCDLSRRGFSMRKTGYLDR